MIGAYFALYLLQYIPSVAYEAYTYFQQRASDETIPRAIIEVIKASGPIGIGSATNAAAIAILLEGVMVLASIINERKRQEGIRIGRQEGIQQGRDQERKRSNAKLRAVAKKYGIPEDELPIEPDDDYDDA